MLNLIRCEIYKLYKTKKIFIAIIFVAISALLCIISEFLLGGPELSKSSGAILPLSMLSNSSSFFIPLIIILCIITLINNEYSNGSLNLLLTKPFSRIQIIVGKLISTMIVVLLMLLSLFVLGYILGGIIFGFNNDVIIKGLHITFYESIRLSILSYLLCIIPYLAFSSLIILISIIFTQSSSASIISVILLIISLVVQSIAHNIAPFLITNYFNIYNLLLEDNLLQCILGISLNLSYLITFTFISIIIFSKKDLKL